MKILLLGAGRKTEDPLEKILIRFMDDEQNFCPIDEVVRLDYNPDREPDVVWDLNVKPWPFPDDTFDQVHAYNVMEHLGRQGDAKAFFDEMYEVWRILKPNGFFMGCCPKMNNPWVFAEPSHTRVLLPITFNFLTGDTELIEREVHNTSTSDFRHLWKGDLRYVWLNVDYSEIDWAWIMQACKGDLFGKPSSYIDAVMKG